MKKFVGTALIAWGLLAGVPATGFAEQRGLSELSKRQMTERHQGRGGQAHHNKWKRWKHNKGMLAPDVPELDLGSSGTGIALLLAATALLLERRRAARA